MNSNSFLFPKLMIGAAVIGVVGAAGMIIYEQLYAEKRRAMLAKEMATLSNQVSNMRQELEALRELQKETQLRRVKPKRRIRREVAPNPGGDTADGPASYLSDSEYFTDYQSVIGDLDSEEFFDVHTDDDDDTLRGSVKDDGETDEEDKSDVTDNKSNSKSSS